VVVTTGQQPGLFGGPVYTWSKAMAALALADAIEHETGIATAAVYWAATDDADFAEASSTFVGRVNGVEPLRSEHVPPAGTPMALAPLGNVWPQLERLRETTGSAADPRPLAVVEQAYGDPTRTVGDAFIALLRELLAPFGIPVLDASHAAVCAAADVTLRSALRSASDIERALTARSNELRAAGHEPQVDDVPDLTLVFRRDGSIKRRVSVKESAAAAKDRAPSLTPNVLLRPVVEHEILPTVAYVGGPGEVAYFAQVTAVAQAMNIAPPLVVPRWSCTLIEPHVARLLDKLGITPQQLAHPHTIEGVLARGTMSPRTLAALDELRRVIDATPGELAAEAEPMGLSAAVQGSIHQLHHRVDRLERRLLAGVKRREAALLNDVATLRGALYPQGTKQERALNLLPTLSRHGMELLEEMRQAAVNHACSLIGT
jgi:bacillithiol biosynthesis cysteine-adding enzyme BshC